MSYTDTGKYIGREFPFEYNKDILIGNDEKNGVYKVKFIESGFECDNIFEEEIRF